MAGDHEASGLLERRPRALRAVSLMEASVRASDAFMTRRPAPGSRRPGPRWHIIRPPRCASQEFPVRSSEAAAAVTRPIQLAPTSSAPRRGSEYAQLSRQIKEAGLLERCPGYYIWKITL